MIFDCGWAWNQLYRTLLTLYINFELMSLKFSNSDRSEGLKILNLNIKPTRMSKNPGQNILSQIIKHK